MELRIRDNGKGFVKEEIVTGVGLPLMAYRAELIGASFSIESSPSGGTVISCRVPLPTIQQTVSSANQA